MPNTETVYHDEIARALDENTDSSIIIYRTHNPDLAHIPWIVEFWDGDHEVPAIVTTGCSTLENALIDMGSAIADALPR